MATRDGAQWWNTLLNLVTESETAPFDTLSRHLPPLTRHSTLPPKCDKSQEDRSDTARWSATCEAARSEAVEVESSPKSGRNEFVRRLLESEGITDPRKCQFQCHSRRQNALEASAGVRPVKNYAPAQTVQEKAPSSLLLYCSWHTLHRQAVTATRPSARKPARQPGFAAPVIFFRARMHTCRL